MKQKTKVVILAIALAVGVAAAQTAPAPTAPAHPAAKGNSQVDAVIGMVKAGLSESFIIKKLVKDNKPVNLTTADMVKLKQAGVSENIMSVMMDPSSAASAAAPAPAPPARRRNPTLPLRILPRQRPQW